MSKGPVPIELQPLGTSPGGGAAHSQGAHGAHFPPPPRREAPSSLSKGYREAEERAKASMNPVEGAMDTTSYYGLAAAGW